MQSTRHIHHALPELLRPPVARQMKEDWCGENYRVQPIPALFVAVIVTRSWTPANAQISLKALPVHDGSSKAESTRISWARLPRVTTPATTEKIDVGHVARSPRPSGPSAVRAFFPVVSSLLLTGVFVGFAKTFFLRSQFDVPLIPAYLYVHGVVLTTWFVLVVAQTFLVAAHRTDLHRRLGVAAVVVGILIIPISAFVVVHAAQRTHGAITAHLRLEIVGDLLSLLWFAGFVAAGVYFRRRPDVHKRLMIASCFTIYGPVFARFNSVYGLPVPTPVVVPLALVTLGAFDLLVARRLHRATVWIAVLFVGVLLPLLGLLIVSGVADTIIGALR
jgi:hypothetical protein